MNVQHIIESPGEVFWYRQDGHEVEVWCLGGLLHCRVWDGVGNLLAEACDHPSNEPVRRALESA